MTLCKNRLERKGGKFIVQRYCGLAIWLGGGAGKENGVPAAAAVVNKVSAREGRWWVWFIRSFKGVMWLAVWNWLSLKEPSRDTGSGGEGKICVCLWLDNTPYTHAPTRTPTHAFTCVQILCILLQFVLPQLPVFYIPAGKSNNDGFAHHINNFVAPPLNSTPSLHHYELRNNCE